MAALTYIRQMKERERIVEKRNQRERRIKEEKCPLSWPNYKNRVPLDLQPQPVFTRSALSANQRRPPGREAGNLIGKKHRLLAQIQRLLSMEYGVWSMEYSD